jgi:hypothetical protein
MRERGKREREREGREQLRGNETLIEREKEKINNGRDGKRERTKKERESKGNIVKERWTTRE